MSLLLLVLSQATCTIAYRVTPPLEIRAQRLFRLLQADYFRRAEQSRGCRCHHYGHRSYLASPLSTTTTTAIRSAKFIEDSGGSSSSSSSSDPRPLNSTTSITSTESLALANQAMKYWAKTKSWRRLSPLVELAVVSHLSTTNATGIQTTSTTGSCIADVGTDHGLLAVALAATGQFKRVTGVDLSELALREGAYQLLDDITVYQQRHNQTSSIKSIAPLPVTFRQGNGLQALGPGEADTICIAGMGVHTMLDILLASSTTNSSLSNAMADDDCSLAPRPRRLLLDELSCQRLILQPTNARPHLLTLLYHQLQAMNWSIRDERIEHLSSRWYLSIALERNATNNVVASRSLALPGTMLAQSTDSETRRQFYKWVSHHATWIRQDTERTGAMRREDEQWLATFGSTETNSVTSAT
jgi:tRNA A22 N-methylase